MSGKAEETKALRYSAAMIPWRIAKRTTEADYQLWSEVLILFRSSRPDLHGVYAQAQILRCTDEVVLLGFEQERALQQLDHPSTRAALKRQLKLLAKRPLEVETVLLRDGALPMD